MTLTTLPQRAHAAGPDPVAAAGPTTAPYALVRVTAIAREPDGPDAARHRELGEQLVAALERAAELGGPLGDALHACAATEDNGFHRRVVLPLRRDVHNRRTPKAVVRAALGGFPERLDLLRRWLDARDDADRLIAEIAAATPLAMAADRRALAVACRAEPLRRAVTMVGEDLLRAVDRAAAQGDAPDARARKSEPTVLRYVLRAGTRTVPLSWFSHVGWGRWGGATSGDPGEPTGSAQPQRAVVAELLGALLTAPDGRAQRPHHLPADLRVVDGHAVFRRSRPGIDSDGGATDEIRLPLTAPLRHVVERTAAAGSLPPAVLAGEIAARLPATSASTAADAYVDGLTTQGLLLPDLPVEPQDPAPLVTLAGIVERSGPAGLATRLRRIDADTRAFADLPAAGRTAALSGLRQAWADTFDDVGAPGTRLAPTSPLTEDVTFDSTVTLGPAPSALARLTPVFETLDMFTALNAAVTDLFVARYGAGGRCASVARFAEDAGELWRRAALVAPDGTVRADPGTIGPRLAAVAAARARLVRAAGPGAGSEVVLSGTLVDAAAGGLPRWVSARPASYSLFALPLPGAGWCVNRVYGGWGRFTSRFLDRLPPDATDEVTARLRRALPLDGRAAQVRPVGGFNGNLHPRLLDDEIADGPWGTLTPGQLHVVHDVATDRVRLCLTATGELVDVLYLGFLVPIALPGHLGPLLNDLGSGLVDLAASLAPGSWTTTAVGRVHVSPRLRYHDTGHRDTGHRDMGHRDVGHGEVVLARRRWRLPSDVAAALRAELGHTDAVPAAVVARWRAALGLPSQVFVSSQRAADPARGASDTGLDTLLETMGRPRSQLLDLGSALHLRCLARTLAGHPEDLVLEEALPVPHPGRPVTEVVVETYRGRS